MSPSELARVVDKRPRKRGRKLRATKGTVGRVDTDDDEHDADAEYGGGTILDEDGDDDCNPDMSTADAGEVDGAEEGRPPRPADPEEVRDKESRKRDKDRIPSRQTYVYDEASATWELRDRPRVMEKGMFFAYTPITPKQETLLDMILADGFVTERFLREELVPRLNRTHPISLRLLDWFVVGYAPEHNFAYEYNPRGGDTRIIVVHELYSSWLARWRRRHFDTFRRRHRIYFDLDGETYSTTVAQLHFFYFLETYGMLRAVELHLPAILQHMKDKLGDSNDAKLEAKALGKEYRRKPLVTKAAQRAFMSEGTFTLSFGNNDFESDDDDYNDYNDEGKDDKDDEDDTRVEEHDCKSRAPAGPT